MKNEEFQILPYDTKPSRQVETRREGMKASLLIFC